MAAAGARSGAGAGQAESRGASHPRLQIQRDDLPALRLYGRAGFEELSGHRRRAFG